MGGAESFFLPALSAFEFSDPVYRAGSDGGHTGVSLRDFRVVVHQFLPRRTQEGSFAEDCEKTDIDSGIRDPRIFFVSVFSDPLDFFPARHDFRWDDALSRTNHF